jgi:hypothetical protein
MDALALEGLPRQYDSGIDSALFHTFSDADRQRYVRSLEAAIRPGGRLFLLCFSDKLPGEGIPRRVSQDEIRATFAAGWEVERIEPCHFEVAPSVAILFPDGAAPAWLSVIRRAG